MCVSVQYMCVCVQNLAVKVQYIYNIIYYSNFGKTA